jgi:hypothetical protein
VGRGHRESDEYGVKDVSEAFALDRHRRPGRHADGKRVGKLVGENSNGLGRMDLVAVGLASRASRRSTSIGGTEEKEIFRGHRGGRGSEGEPTSKSDRCQ